MSDGTGFEAGGWVDRGDELREQGRYKEALEAYDEAIKIEPRNADTWANKGGNAGLIGPQRGSTAGFR